MLPSYSDIYATYHRVAKDILDGPVVVQEKIDGSQFSFGLMDGTTLEMRSKGTAIYPNQVPALFKPAVDTVVRLLTEDKLPPYLIFRAEAVCKPKHNLLKYDRTPVGGLIVYDVGTRGENYLGLVDAEVECRALGLEFVPTYYSGLMSPEMISSLTSRMDAFVSCLGGEIEGIVIKNYGKFTPEHKVLMAKVVRDRFKEAGKREWKPGPSVVESIVTTLRTEERWNKAIQHLSESGVLVNTPQDIGPLIKEINLDILKEETDFMKEKLFESAWKEIARGVTRGFPEWYKAKLQGDMS